MKRVYGWAGVRYVITKFSQVDSLPNFLTHGAPLCALRAREELRYYFNALQKPYDNVSAHMRYID